LNRAVYRSYLFKLNINSRGRVSEVNFFQVLIACFKHPCFLFEKFLCNRRCSGLILLEVGLAWIFRAHVGQGLKRLFGFFKLKIRLEAFKIGPLYALHALKFVKILKILLHKSTKKISGP
jgi:hypothetical protein